MRKVQLKVDYILLCHIKSCSPCCPFLQLVVSRAIQTVPYPLLGENTLVLSDSMVLAKDEKGNLALMFRSASQDLKCCHSLECGCSGWRLSAGPQHVFGPSSCSQHAPVMS